jgi:hypothetical protein
MSQQLSAGVKVCKTSTPGSNPGGASKFINQSSHFSGGSGPEPLPLPVALAFFSRGRPILQGSTRVRFPVSQQSSPLHASRASLTANQPMPSRGHCIDRGQYFAPECGARTRRFWEGQEERKPHRHHRPEAYPSSAATSTAATKDELFSRHRSDNRPVPPKNIVLFNYPPERVDVLERRMIYSSMTRC